MKINRLAKRGAAVAAAAVCLTTVCATAHAQSIYGPGGLFLNPTADMPAKGALTPAILVVPAKLQGAPGHLSWASYDLDYGLTRDLEIGATYLKISPGGGVFDKASKGGYAKYLVLKEHRGLRPAIAIGGSALGGGNANTTSGFVAAKWSLSDPQSEHPMHLHAGALYFNKLDGTQRGEAAPYAGMDYVICPSMSAFAEYRAGLRDTGNGDDTHPAHSIGVVLYPWKDYELVLAYANNGWNSGPGSLAVGIGYSLGGRR